MSCCKASCNYVLLYFTTGKQGLIYLCFVSNCWETEKQGGVTRAYTAIQYTRGWRQQEYIPTWRFGISPRISSSEGKHVLYKKVSFTSHSVIKKVCIQSKPKVQLFSDIILCIILTTVFPWSYSRFLYVVSCGISLTTLSVLYSTLYPPRLPL